MAKIPLPIHQTAALVFRAYEEREEREFEFRPHLGASLIGHECSRHLWLTFRWAMKPSFPGRVLRLFKRGQDEEARVVADLRAIGCEVHDVDEQGQQFRVALFGGHFGGSMDGAAHRIPEAPKSWHVLEIKTHNDKSFQDLVKRGVRESKPQHFAQMTIYMGLTGMRRALYFAVNKNNDDIHTERIEFDQALFERLVRKAERIVFADAPLERISNDPSWYQCKFCDHNPVCHGKLAPLPNCRTCTHATPERDGTWRCGWLGKTLSEKEQGEGCEHHRFIPPILDNFAEPVDADPKQNWIKYRDKRTGEEFTNGNPLSSARIHELQAAKEGGCDPAA